MNLKKSGTNICMFDIHDGKMLYMLTGHSQWNRKHHPFLLCSCSRGEGVKNSDHICRMISHSEHQRLYDRSVTQWIRKRDKSGDIYDKKAHLDWIDIHNTGISHFGIEPRLLPLTSIRFDVFHLRSAITRNLLSRLREFIYSQDFDLMKGLEEILSTTWNSYFILVWNSNRKLTSLRGKEIVGFIQIIPKIVGFIKEKFVISPYLHNLCEGLSLWEEISSFIHRTVISNNSEYEQNISVFKHNVQIFYQKGADSFLTKSETGDSETFYMHVLRFYLPTIVDSTWKDYGLGIGIYSMQGFERRNKEAKAVFKNHTNKRGNVIVQCMNRLLEKFNYN